MPPNVATAFGPGPVYAAIRHGSPSHPHVLVNDIPVSSSGPSTTISPFRSDNVGGFCPSGRTSSGNFTGEFARSFSQGGHDGSAADSGFRAGYAGDSSGLCVDAGDRLDHRARPHQIGAAEAAPLRTGPASAARPAAASLTDQILAVLILNLIAVAIWSLAASPLFREIAIGSVTALPWWVWGAFAVFMGAIAGGQVR